MSAKISPLQSMVHSCRCGRSSRPSHTPLANPQLAGETAVPLISNPTACQMIRTPPVYPCLAPESCKSTANWLQNGRLPPPHRSPPGPPNIAHPLFPLTSRSHPHLGHPPRSRPLPPYTGLRLPAHAPCILRSSFARPSIILSESFLSRLLPPTYAGYFCRFASWRYTPLSPQTAVL